MMEMSSRRPQRREGVTGRAFDNLGLIDGRAAKGTFETR